MFFQRLMSIGVVGALWCSPAMGGGMWDVCFKGDSPAAIRAATRFSRFQMTENIRFHGNGLINWARPSHGHSTGGFDEAPQTGLGACVHYLFPSPDGVECAPNTAISDPLSQLKGAAVGVLYKMCAEALGDKESQKREVYQFLLDTVHPKTTPDYETLHPHFKKLAKFEIRQALVRHIGMYDNLIEKRGDLPYTAFVQKSFPEAIPVAIKLGQLEDHMALHKQSARKPDQESPDSVEPEPSHKLLTRAEEYDRHAGAYSCMRFASAFVDALEENPSWLQDVLMVYAWKKAENEPTETAQRGSIRAFHKQAFAEELSDDFFTNIYTDEEYVELKSQIEASPELWNTLNMSQLALLYQGEQTFGRPIPPVLATGRALYQGHMFSDCAETALRYLVCAFSYKKTARGYEVDPTVYPEGSKARAFLSEFGNRALLGEARNRWAEVVSNLPGLEYVKSCGRRAKKRYYEMTSCGFNNLRALIRIIENPEAPFAHEKFQKDDWKPAWRRIFTVVGDQISEIEPKNLGWSDDTMTPPAIGITRFGLPAGSIEWESQVQHVSVRRTLTNEKTLAQSLEPLADLLSDPVRMPYALTFLSSEFLKEVLPTLEEAQQRTVLYALNLREPSIVLTTLQFIFSKKISSCYGLAKSMLAWAEDGLSNRDRQTGQLLEIMQAMFKIIEEQTTSSDCFSSL